MPLSLPKRLIWIIIPLAVLAGCATSTPAPSRTAASATAPAAASSANTQLLALARRLHSPKLMAQVLLREAREKKDPARAIQAAIYAFDAGDENLALQAGDLLKKLQPDDPASTMIRLRVALGKGDMAGAFSATEQLYALGGAGAIYQVFQGRYDPWYLYALARRLSAAHPADPKLTQLLAQAALQAGDNDAALSAARRADKAGLDDLLTQIVQMEAEWQLGHRHAALIRGARVLAAHSHDAALRALYAGLLIRSRDYARARAVLGDGAALDPGNTHIQLAYVLLDQTQGRFRAARKRLTRMLEQGSADPSVYYQLGQEAAGQGNWSQAFVWYSSARGSDAAQTAAVFALKQWKGLDAAHGYVGKLKKHLPGLMPLWVATEAGLLDEAGDAGAAYAMLDSAVKRYPMVRPLRYQLALIADKLHKPGIAIGTLGRLVKAEPGNAEYLNAYGYVLTEHTHRYQEGYDYIRRALEAYPDNPAILDSMGWVLYKLGKPKQALGYLKRAHAGSTDVEVTIHLVTVYLALGRKKSAGRLIKTALARAPHNIELKRLRQRILQ